MDGLTSILDTDYFILSHLNYGSIISFGLTCKYNMNYCFDQDFWMQMVNKDFPGTIQYKHLDLSYREMYKNLYYEPDFETAMRKGDLYVVVWLYQKGLRPTEFEIDLALVKNYLHILEWLSEKGILPNSNSANILIKLNNLFMLQWLDEKGILPTVKGLDSAYTCDIELLEWVKEKGLIPTRNAADYATNVGNMTVVKWLESVGVYRTI
jgi:hypothetical protein